MLLSFFLISIITAGGMVITYRLADEEPLLWRLAAGCVIGSAIYGTAGAIIGLVFGLTTISAALLSVGMLLPLLLFLNERDRRSFARDRVKAAERLQGKSFRRVLPFLYYAFFIILFLLFFERAMFFREGAILTGASNNLGDLAFHLGAIFSFTEGANFPPENPNFAGARFSYPFIADLTTAYFVKLGADVSDAMLVQNVAWAFSLLIILERFVFRLLNDRLAARLAPFLLFFSGGLGFIWFFGDWFAQQKGFFDFLNSIPKDYTIGDQFRWGNSLVTLFITQRSLLLGMPIALIVLGFLWRWISAPRSFQETGPDGSSMRTPMLIHLAHYVAIGLLAGMLPLIHLHSLFVLFIVAAVLFVVRRDLWAQWIAFGIGVCVVAVPELLWSITGSASNAGDFVSRHFGWDSRDSNLIWFWLKNTGLFIPMLIAGIYLVWLQIGSTHATDVSVEGETKRKKKRSAQENDLGIVLNPNSLLIFYVPFLMLFVIANLFKLAPWEWDNIKVLIYWWIGSIPFVTYALVRLWRSKNALRSLAPIVFAILIFSGALDVYRTASKQINITVFDREAVEISEAIRTRSTPRALVLSAPTYNTAVVLSGRRSVMRYPGHLSSHGIDYTSRENDIRTIYSGGPEADSLLERYGVDLVLFGPEVANFANDRNRPFALNEEHFKKYPQLAATGQYRIYKMK